MCSFFLFQQTHYTSQVYFDVQEKMEAADLSIVGRHKHTMLLEQFHDAEGQDGEP